MRVAVAAFPSAPSLVVLHALRVSGRVPTPTLPELAGLEVPVIDGDSLLPPTPDTSSITKGS